jgi:hypothetical protein
MNYAIMYTSQEGIPMTDRELTARRLAAFARCYERKGWESAIQNPDLTYAVESSDRKRWYTVSQDITRCDCKAGQAGVPCWHLAAAFQLAHGLCGVKVTGLHPQPAPVATERGQSLGVALAPLPRERSADLGGDEEDGPSLRELLGAA